ncbi:MAG: hypothetical protein ACPG7F_15675, partial [Aggregatilineales bacterium]
HPENQLPDKSIEEQERDILADIFSEDFSFDDVDFGDDGGDFGDDADDFGDLAPSGISFEDSFDDFEDEDDVSLDEDYLGAAGFDDEEIDIDDDPEEERGGIRPAFLILGLLLLLLLIGGGAALILGAQGERDRVLNVTRTAIANINETTAANAAGRDATSTQSFIDTQTAVADAEENANIAATQTAEDAANATMTVIAQETLNFEATGTATAMQGASVAMTQTALAGDTFQTQTAIAELLDPDSDADQTQTAIAQLTADGGDTGTDTGLTVGAVQQTATALAGLLTTPTQQVGIPGGNTGGALTPIATIVPGNNTGGADNNQLPDTGVFDDIAPGALAGLALLLGLALVFARGGRIANRKS